MGEISRKRHSRTPTVVDNRRRRFEVLEECPNTVMLKNVAVQVSIRLRESACYRAVVSRRDYDKIATRA
jgi:hypothetical protein